MQFFQVHKADDAMAGIATLLETDEHAHGGPDRA
jgi:hypothetical protein